MVRDRDLERLDRRCPVGPGVAVDVVAGDVLGAAVAVGRHGVPVQMDHTTVGIVVDLQVLDGSRGHRIDP